MESVLKLSTSLHSRISELTDVPEDKKYKEVDQVRIIPAKIIFDGAFDGKAFNRSFTIINCGKYNAFVRILPPSSKAFKTKPIPKGFHLSAGMSISRSISYTHTSALALPEASIIVYVNEKPVVYQLEVTLNVSLIVITPNILDFGQVDVQTPSQPRTIMISNKGKKKASFSVDIRRSELDLMVKPMKGTINPSQVIEMSVEVLGSTLGHFSKEFWIKTDPPKRVRVIGTLCEPILELVYPLKSHRLALVDFSRTYYGAKITKPLVIQNSSSVSSMFCIVLERGYGFDLVESAKKDSKNDDLRCFDMFPKDGRLQAGQVSVLQFAFQPRQAKSFLKKPYKDFALVFLRVVKVYFRDGTVGEGQVKAYEAKTDTVAEVPTRESIASVINEKPFYLTEGLEDDLQICLYGEMEKASVELVPASFHMTYLKVNQVYTYDLLIKNLSTLPITLDYKKVACVEVEPKLICLSPNSKVEVVLIIKPSKIGPVDVNVVFDLLHKEQEVTYKVGTARLSLQYSITSSCTPIEPKFNLGITPKITNEVGFMTDDVRFNSSVNKPIQAIVDKNYMRFNKNNSDIIAFPNDMPKSLRPRTNIATYRTIYANIPRYSNGHNEYALNDTEANEKERNKQVYVDYIRNSAKCQQKYKRIQTGLPHYEICDEKRILLQELNIMDYKIHQPVLQESISVNIPLSPLKLVGVKINPRYIELGMLAPYTSCRESFTIENDNEFAINVSIKAKSSAVYIKGKKMLTIQARETKQIFFDCTSYDIGKYYVPVYIIVNGHHIFDSLLYANVVPTTVRCPIEQVSIDMRDMATCFEIFNPLNCDITFSWEVQGVSLAIYPLSGKIPPNRSIYCRLSVDSCSKEESGNELYLISQSGDKHIIPVYSECKKAEVGFSTTNIKFENIPLNTTVSKVLILRNFSDMDIVYVIANPNILNEIKVGQVTGKVRPRCDIQFEILANFKEVVKFKCELEFIIQNAQSYFINIEGNVIYPKVFFEPRIVQFRKLPAGAYQRKLVRATNLSEVQCYIDFSLEDFEEIFVADAERRLMEMPIYLKPNEARDLFLEFVAVEPIAYSMYLPYVVNGIIGPPVLNNPRSVHPSSYFNAEGNMFMKNLELPDILPTVIVRCAAGSPWVEISSLEINFSSNNDTVKSWTVTNISQATHCLTVPIISPQSSFRIDIENGSDCKTRNEYYEKDLDPSEEIVFRITFTPIDFGIYTLELPIYFDKSVEACPFNYLKLTGTYNKPNILCSKRILYFQVISLPGRASEVITLKLSDHETNCKINIEVGDETLSAIFTDEITPGANTGLNVLVTFIPKNACYIDSEITFKCSCDASCKLMVKTGANSCIFECYASVIRYKASLLSTKFMSTFPFFPPVTDDGYYAERMRLIEYNFEKFIYIQRTFCKDYIDIPESLSAIPVSVKPVSNSKGYEKPCVLLPPLVNILIYLIKPAVRKHFMDCSLKPTYEGVEGVVFLYTLYRNIINFLKVQGIFVPQMEPEHLMPYEFYTIFKKSVKHNEAADEQTPPEDILSEELFFRFAKQCWLDLLLKLFKVFVFDRTIFSKAAKKSKTQTDVYYKDFKKYYSENHKTFKDKDLYSGEVKLLLWFEFHYEKQKGVLFDLREYPQLKKKRKFTNFDVDFADGIAVAMVIFAYCPYLKNDLKKFYPIADTEEKTFHNACLIQQAIKRINLPSKLFEPGASKLSSMYLTFVGCYLYDVLPGFYPRETIELSAALGDTAANEITLTNNNDFTIAYTPVFFFNDKKYFTSDTDCVVIQPKKNKAVRVNYCSKSILKLKAVLVFSGETEGYKSARSIAIHLVGIPKISEFTETYNLKVDVFMNVTKHIEIESPFDESYTAKLYLYLGSFSKTPEDITEFTPVLQVKQKNFPRQFCMDPICTFEDGCANYRLELCFVCVGQFVYNIYLVNEEVGDFCIQVNIISKVNKNTATDLEVTIDRNFSLDVDCSCKLKPVCTCKSATLSCAKLIVVNIPCKNDDLVQAIRNMFKLATEEQEYKFWNELLGYPKGFHILRNRLKIRFCDPICRSLIF